ncbi:TPA: NupC/NupG family nucleoside CNT transporter [Photobacterium damselae]|uniref:Nucleoside permease n=3 Tax=Photobacterium damselae TaxID=38293 RepID=A0A7V7QGW1_PHODD|nr:NupC/NupG family nucleoside CNT transporter [Photobacterium damselae]AWK82682.1 nucleoside transporter NupC [Photobacterium damselae]EHA1082280.1 NupC/NupG family nucleoside CNT transporter [Photobacterium damselae]KAB1176161.1 NupC/NupG family nucleoside CNT transporter [Photobacterium damselae subsp. damselae]KAB1183600.1 NupC/NupG family nucleoside CNT transporter [Photobacterium damselae subsp. damselae]MBA5682972.1 NupC/NupG family nucleoside CNT transporter [Photobacterium damselae su
MSLFMSLVGMVVLLAIAVLLSDNRKAINLRTVGGAFAIQFLLGAFVLYVPVGRDVLYGMSQGVANVIAYGNDGINFLFGGLTSDKMFEVFGGGGFVFALRVLPVIVFFSALISVLYYLGVMQIVINVLGGGLRKVLGTSHAESMSATANIFVGQTEAPLVVRPFVPKMTQSELFAVMCGGLASVAGGVLAGYASMGVPLEYLIAASFMAAPGGLLFAKIIKPETEQPVEQLAGDDENADEKPANVIDAAAAGASSGMQLALNVGAMLLAFIGLIALVNGLLGGIGGWFGMPHLTLELILGYVFSPLAFLIGVPWNESLVAGSFIGQKLVVNEFVAYLNFAPYLKDVADGGMVVAQTGAAMGEKTKAIVSFALCGFANLSSVAILLGGLGGLAPTRRAEIARFGMKAVAAGTLSNLMSATIAGLFVSLSM